MFQYLSFDLDGTLTDPGLGITNSVMYALRKMGREANDREPLYRFIGPPLQDSFSRFCGFEGEQCEQAISYYREYFREKGKFENEVYPKIPEVLQTLKDSGYKLIVATSKPEIFSIEILQHFGLFEYFDLVAGATMDSSRSKKGDIIRYALEKMGIQDRSKALMIGDREHDIFGAKENGLMSLGVLYGYGDRQELEKAGADLIAETPEDLLKVIR